MTCADTGGISTIPMARCGGACGYATMNGAMKSSGGSCGKRRWGIRSMGEVRVAAPFEANCCHMPKPVTAAGAEVYRKIRDTLMRAHCADSRPAHRCAGEVTLDCNSITLHCPRCGDSKGIISD